MATHDHDNNNRKAKPICIGCCLCAVVVVAVMVPVSLYVIAPKVAQHTLDTTEISLPNMTMAACDTPYAKVWNHAKMIVPALPIKAESTLLTYNQSVYTTVCYLDDSGTPTAGMCCGSNWVKACMDLAGIPQNNGTEEEILMGTYMQPEMKVSDGVNYKDFVVVMGTDLNIVMFAWVVPLMMVKIPARLVLKANDVSVKVMGVTIKGRTVHSRLTCFAVEDPITAPTVSIPGSVCHPDDPKAQPYSSQAYRIVCDSGDHVPTTAPPSASRLPTYVV